VISPNTPGPAGDVDSVQTVAEIGVAFLLFTLGVKFSLRDLTQSKGLALTSGVLVSSVMLGVGTVAGLALGLGWSEAVVIGMVVSISSTMVALRLLEDRGVIGAPAGRIGVVTALTQDIFVVVLVVLLPLLGNSDEDLVTGLGRALFEAAAIIVGIWIIGTIVLPPVLARVAASRSREMFLLAIVAFALGTAAISHDAGLSVALGAFIAGLLLSESPYAHRTLTEVFPLRELFAVVFFVSIGMLIDFDSFVDDTRLVIVVASIGLGVKMVLITGASLALGFGVRAAVAAGVALGNMGEFSFVLVNQALSEEVVTPEISSAVIAAVVLTVAVSPLLFVVQERLIALAERRGWLAARTQSALGEERLAHHAIIAGYTEAGRELALALSRRGFRYVVIDEDPAVFKELEGDGVNVVLGDPAFPAVLEQAAVSTAIVVAITLTDPAHVESVAAVARTLNRRVDVVARATTSASRSRLRQIGASRVVEGELEVGAELVRHTLQRFGMTSQEVQLLLWRRRQDLQAEERA
jgi:CPA2 family monovalent cation:H+ antiporter-2